MADMNAMTDKTQARPCDVLVLQHTLEDGPGYLGHWLDTQGVGWQALCTQADEAYPASVAGYRALAVLGGEWSANDDRASLRQAEALIREADALGIPVLGHCLGGQLMARAFGARIARLDAPEVGWMDIHIADSAPAQDWLGPAGVAKVYQWHYDGVVDLPAGAQGLARSAACAHQAFALGPHLAMQFHIEITPLKIQAWLEHPGEVYPAAVHTHPASVQDTQTMHRATEQHLAGSEALARRIYQTWRTRWRA